MRISGGDFLLFLESTYYTTFYKGKGPNESILLPPTKYEKHCFGKLVLLNTLGKHKGKGRSSLAWDHRLQKVLHKPIEVPISYTIFERCHF